MRIRKEIVITWENYQYIHIKNNFVFYKNHFYLF